MIRLRMVIPEEPGVAPLYRNLLERYMSARPDVEVVLEQVEYETDPQYWRKIWEKRHETGLPDVIYTHYSWFPVAVRQGALLDITERFQRAAHPPADFFDTTLKPFQYLGRLYTVPRETSSMVVFYNETLLRRQKLPLPNELDAEGKWTWETFRKLALAVADPARDLWGAVAPTEVPFSLFPVLRSFGCDILSGASGRHFNVPEAVRAITMIRDMIVKDRSALLPAADADRSVFTAGRAAFMIGGYWHIAVAMSFASDFEWDVAPIPYGTCRGTRTGAGGYSIAATSGHADAAWELIEWLSLPDNALFLAQSGLIIPALRRAAESERFLNPGKRPFHRCVFVEALEYGRPDPIIPRWDEVLFIVRDELGPVWTGKKEPEEAVRAIDARLNRLLAESSVPDD